MNETERLLTDLLVEAKVSNTHLKDLKDTTPTKESIAEVREAQRCMKKLLYKILTYSSAIAAGLGISVGVMF
jgi:hypothetical protein